LPQILTHAIPFGHLPVRNPVRAGLVRDPKDYRWSGYGAAMAGRRRAKEGLQKVVTGLQRRVEESLTASMALYPMHLYDEGSEEWETVGQDGRPVRGALRREEVLKVLRAKGKLPLGTYLRCRVRYFRRSQPGLCFTRFRGKLGTWHWGVYPQSPQAERLRFKFGLERNRHGHLPANDPTRVWR
jgi:hypothetical protein